MPSLGNATSALISFKRLIWFMPAAYALHIVEEYVGGFAGWVTNVVGGAMSDVAFALNNVAFMAILLALTAWTSLSGSRLASFLLIVWASANLFWDFLFHLLLTAHYDRYSPGLITAVLLYYPLSLAIGTLAVRQGVLRTGHFVGAVSAGAALMAFVIWYGLFHFTI